MGCWRGQPQWLCRVVAALALLLVYGTARHIVQLVVAAGEPYPELPLWLRAYLGSLTALDPLAAVLLLRRRRSGVVLAVAVLVTDSAANALANFAFDQAGGVTAGRVGQAVITVLAVGGVAAVPALLRATSRRVPVRCDASIGSAAR